ncbi:hypothetical protein [Nostoc sp.]
MQHKLKIQPDILRVRIFILAGLRSLNLIFHQFSGKDVKNG